MPISWVSRSASIYPTSCDRLPQIPHHETRGLVDERFNRFIPEHVGVVQNRIVGQRLDRCRAHECRDFQFHRNATA